MNNLKTFSTSFYLLQQNDKWQHTVSKTGPKDKKKEEDNRKILCYFCYHQITNKSAIIKINGSHNHTFSNPSGIIYEICCFKTAKGCIVNGKPTTNFTWFTGFNWNFALCGNCLNHLGWFYRNNLKNSFFGLIKNFLIEI